MNNSKLSLGKTTIKKLSIRTGVRAGYTTGAENGLSVVIKNRATKVPGVVIGN